MIGFRGDLLSLLDAGWDEYQETRDSLLPQEFNPYIIAGEQQLYSYLFSRGMAGIDYESRLFLSMYKVDAAREIRFTANGTLAARVATRRTFPVAVHFNGDSKPDVFNAVAMRISYNAKTPWYERLWEEGALYALANVCKRVDCASHTTPWGCLAAR